MEPELLAHRLRARARALRSNRFQCTSLYQPQSVHTDTIVTPTGLQKRRRVVLTAHGCRFGGCSMCSLPDEAVHAEIPVTEEHWIRQLDFALNRDEDIHTLTLFHNGNFFSDAEVSETLRREIYRFVRTTRVRELVVESLPHFVTEARLRQVRTELGAVRLVTALGLQSSSKLVREICIASPCRLSSFEAAVKGLRAQGDDAQVFLLFQPPFLTPEEAVYDLRESIDYVHRIGLTPTICPLRIAPHTIAGELHSLKLLEPPGRKLLYNALLGISDIRIAMSLLFDRDDPRLLDAFSRLNRGEPLPPPEPQDMLSVTPTPPDPIAVYRRIERYLESRRRCTALDSLS